MNFVQAVVSSQRLGRAVATRYLGLGTLAVLLFSATGFADTITGTATNGTTGKPAAGDEVVLIKLAQGMQESMRTKTNAKGEFSLAVDNSSEPHLVRVKHQDVNYFRPAPPGTSSVEVQVYDVAKKVAGIATTVDVMRMQTENGVLQVLEQVAVKNTSKPPRTQSSDNNYAFQLPEGASIDSAFARSPGGQPVNSAPVPLDQKGRYTFTFPLRPGETQFQIGYHLPYSGQIKIQPRPLSAVQHFVVMLPKEMQFQPDDANRFQPLPEETSANVQVATGVQPGDALAFAVSGNGTLPTEETASENRGVGGQQVTAENRGRPGGGLGPPTDAPDPLHGYRWYILGGIVAVLAFGAVSIVTRSSAVPLLKRAAVAGVAGNSSVGNGLTPRSVSAVVQDRSSNLLDALKEELFELEVDHQQGRISQPEYEKAKAALDHTLQRALTRKR